jgi:hypothetical protein
MKSRKYLLKRKKFVAPFRTNQVVLNEPSQLIISRDRRKRRDVRNARDTFFVQIIMLSCTCMSLSIVIILTGYRFEESFYFAHINPVVWCVVNAILHCALLVRRGDSTHNTSYTPSTVQWRRPSYGKITRRD